MTVQLTKLQGKMLAALVAAKNDVEMRMNTVIATIAAGANIEAWNSVKADTDALTIEFVQEEKPEMGT